MLSVRALHRQGMAAHERVFVARHRRPDDRDLLAAWREEARAAALVVRTYPADRSSEPTRGVLCRSAAWMALDCDFLDAATWLVQTGRAGQPYANTQVELDECQAAIDVARDRQARRAAPPASVEKEPV